MRVREPFAKFKEIQDDIKQQIDELTEEYLQNELKLGRDQAIATCQNCHVPIPYRRGRVPRWCAVCRQKRDKQRVKIWREKNPVKYRKQLRRLNLKRNAWKRRADTKLSRIPPHE